MKTRTLGMLAGILGGLCGPVVPAADLPAPAMPAADSPSLQQLRLVQDDAQDYMVSKVYVLKYVQANDIYPFVQGIVKRYNNNSAVNCIEFGDQNEQILTVSCPEGMMPYVDEFVAKADRDVTVDGRVPGDIIRGTGITRMVYTPKYRSGQTLVNIIVNAFINAGPYGSVYAYDANSNQIYWKDNSSNSQFSSQFLGFLDRPAPQINLSFKIYEVRDSTLRDIGVDYLAWKNGPGMNIFQAGFQAFSVNSAGSAALQNLSGPWGGFFFAPQFDASFIRILEQSGNAEITGHASLTVSNSDTESYEIFFNPGLQNLIKSESDQSEVTTGSVSALQDAQQLCCRINQPIVCLHSGGEIDFELPDYVPGQYADVPGTLFFGYEIAVASAAERNNYGSELIETAGFSGSVTMPLGEEFQLGRWERESSVRQTIGLPWLCEIPILGYLFSTTTTQKVTSQVVLTVTAEVLDTSHPSPEAGTLFKLSMDQKK